MAKKICSLDNSVSIYQKTINHFNYYICMNDNDCLEYKIYIGFPFINLNELIDDDIASFMLDIYNGINPNNDSNIIYLLPSIDMDLYKEATMENDDKLYIDLFSKICNVTNNAYKYLRKTDDVKINQMITIIRQNDMDDKFCMWLELNPNVSNYITSIKVNTREIEKNLRFLIKKRINDKIEQERIEQERIEQERIEQERIEQERIERERLEQEKLERFEKLGSEIEVDLVDNKNDIDDDLDNTIVVNSVVEEYKNISQKYRKKRRLLIKPTVNQYGFSNMYSIVLGLVFSVFTGLILGLVLLK